MGNFSCKCGAVTNDGPVYDENSWVCLTIDQAREIETSVAEQSIKKRDLEVIEDIVAGEINARFIPMFRCPKCERLYIGRNDSSNIWEAFVPDGKIP